MELRRPIFSIQGYFNLLCYHLALSVKDEHGLISILFSFMVHILFSVLLINLKGSLHISKKTVLKVDQ